MPAKRMICVITCLNPQAAIQRGVTITRIDATPFTPYDIKRLQAATSARQGPLWQMLQSALRLFWVLLSCSGMEILLRSRVLLTPNRQTVQRPLKLRQTHVCNMLTIPRVQAYANNLVDYHLVLDLLPPLTGAYFAGEAYFLTGAHFAAYRTSTTSSKIN
eukprot:1161671-Pelagomonas_calceolata.AAC.1